MNFLVDVNLPKKFSYFNFPNFEFVCDINLSMSVKKIWEYALLENKTILTKDVDFYNRYLVSTKCPKVIYFALGNLSLKEMHSYFEKNWAKIVTQIQEVDFSFGM